MLHPVFGDFLERSRDPSLASRRDADFAAELCHEALLLYPNERERQLILVGGDVIVRSWVIHEAVSFELSCRFLML